MCVHVGDCEAVRRLRGKYRTAPCIVTVSTFSSGGILSLHFLVGLVVKVSALRVEDPGLDSCLCCGSFAGSVHTSD